MRLGSIAEIIRGVTFVAADASRLPGAGRLPILRSGNIQSSLILDRDLIFVPETLVSPAQRLRPGDIAICTSSGSASVVGKAAPLTEPFAGSVGAFCAIVRPVAAIPEYVALWFRSDQYRSWLKTQSRGASIQNIRLSELLEIDLPVASAAMQGDVVARSTVWLDSVRRLRVPALQELAATRLARTTLLRDAFSGPSADGWRMVRLRDASEFISDGTHQPPAFAEAGVPFLFVKNIVGGVIDFEVDRYVSEETFKELTKRRRPQRGDILFSAVGSFGTAVVVNTDRAFTFQRHIAHIRLRTDLADGHFIATFLNSPAGRQQSERAALGGAQRTVTLSSLGNFRVPMPAVGEQRRVAAELHERLATIDAVTRAIEEQLEAIDALPAALLRRAFADLEAA